MHSLEALGQSLRYSVKSELQIWLRELEEKAKQIKPLNRDECLELGNTLDGLKPITFSDLNNVNIAMGLPPEDFYEITNKEVLNPTFRQFLRSIATNSFLIRFFKEKSGHRQQYSFIEDRVNCCKFIVSKDPARTMRLYNLLIASRKYALEIHRFSRISVATQEPFQVILLLDFLDLTYIASNDINFW